jgi:4-hydroxybenzoate polyprenyltransferase
MDRGVAGEHGGGATPGDPPGADSVERSGAGALPPWFKRPPTIQDYLFLLRPMILIPVWTFFILGAHHGRTAGARTARGADLLIGIVSFTALLGAVYIVNQIADREADRANRKLFLIPDGIISVRAAWIEAAILVASSFLLALLLPPRFAIVLALSLVLGCAYSLEPVRLKKRAVLDVCANAVGNGILNTLAGWTAIGAPLDGWRVLLPYPLAVASVHLSTTLADRAGDARTMLRTSGVAAGPRAGTLVATGLMFAAVAAARAVDNTPAFYAALLSLPFFLIPARSGRHAPPSAFLVPAKIAVLVFSIVAGILFPLYLPVLVAVIFLTRRYYRSRFDMNYPSL